MAQKAEAEAPTGVADTGEIASLKAQNEELKLAVEKAAKAVSAAVEGAERDRLAIAELTAERDALKRQLSAQKGATTKVRRTVEQLEAAARPRKLGALADDDRTLAPADILELIDDADLVELAFSDGRAELTGVPPVRLPDNAFTHRRGVLQLDVESLQVTGPNTTRAAPSLAGFALLLDGEQVAWSPLPSPMPLGAGQSYELKDSVRFT